MITIPMSRFVGTGYATTQLEAPVATGDVRIVLAEDDRERVTVIFDATTLALRCEREHHLDCPQSGRVTIHLGDSDDWQVADRFRAARTALGPLAGPLGFPQVAAGASA